MKYVCLIRHAKAAKNGSDDFSRPLTKEGIEESGLLGKSMKNDGYSCDLVISSGAARAFETAAIVAGSIGIKQRKIRIENSLYQGTGIDTYYRILRDLEDSVDSVIITGHNTTLDAAAADMCPDYDRRMTTGSAVCLQYDVKSWQDIKKSESSISFYKFNAGKKKLSRDEKSFIQNFRKNTVSSIKSIFTAASKKIMFSDFNDTVSEILEAADDALKNSTIVTITDLNELRNQTTQQEN